MRRLTVTSEVPELLTDPQFYTMIRAKIFMVNLRHNCLMSAVLIAAAALAMIPACKDTKSPFYRGFPSLHGAVMNGNLKDVEFVLNRGNDVNKLDQFGIPPLVYAVQHQRGTDVINLLLKRGANPNLPSCDGSLPLEYAVLLNDRQAVQLLMERGADPNLKIDEQMSPLELASSEGNRELVKLLSK